MVHKNMIWQRKPLSMSVTFVIHSRRNSWLLVLNLQTHHQGKAFCSLCLQREATTLQHPVSDAVRVSVIFQGISK